MIPNPRAKCQGRIGRTGLPWGTDPTTSDVTYTDDEREFMVAVERYQRRYHCRHLTAADVLTVARELGYRLAEPGGRTTPDDSI